MTDKERIAAATETILKYGNDERRRELYAIIVAMTEDVEDGRGANEASSSLAALEALAQATLAPALGNVSELENWIYVRDRAQPHIRGSRIDRTIHEIFQKKIDDTARRFVCNCP